MKIINISTGLKNLYQMATKRRPKAECNTTAASMGIYYTGHPMPVAYEQMPDYLMDVLNSSEGWEYLNKKFPGAKYNPWNSSVCIAWAVNKVIGKEICIVKDVIFPEIVSHVGEGGAVIIGGGFLSKTGATSGHFVCIVGFKGTGFWMVDPKDGSCWGFDDICTIEIIGNIYENPELLK